MKRGPWKAATFVAALAALLAIGVSQGLASHVSCGQTITTSTTFDSNLTNCPGNGIVVGASNITINLAGHTIDGDGGASDVGILNAGGYDGITVKRGWIREFGTGILLISSDSSLVKSLKVSRIDGTGILLTDSDSDRVAWNLLSKNGGDGIFVNSGSDSVRLLHNAALRNGDDGIDTDNATAILTRNIAIKNHDLGIEAVPGVTDGGGNIALLNGNPLQCTNIACLPGSLGLPWLASPWWASPWWP